MGHVADEAPVTAQCSPVEEMSVADQCDEILQDEKPAKVEHSHHKQKVRGLLYCRNTLEVFQP